MPMHGAELWGICTKKDPMAVSYTHLDVYKRQKDIYSLTNVYLTNDISGKYPLVPPGTFYVQATSSGTLSNVSIEYREKYI